MKLKAVRKKLGLSQKEMAKRFGITKGVPPNEGNATSDRVLSFMAQNGGRLANAETLTIALGIARITALRHLSSLVAQGKVRRVGSRKTGHWALAD
ncbi:MAG: helix-turn-helix domain-containing protein [Bacilli bacterium]|nr:helix-turn-helix domain-containing protein [Bacilli bacterium]